MSDEVTIPDVEPVADTTEETAEVSVDDKIQAAITAAEERFKADVAGLNRRNSELEKELESEKVSHLSDKEKLEYEKQLRETDLADREAKLAEAVRVNMITNGLASNKLDISVANLMRTPATAEELQTWVTDFSVMVQTETEKRVNEALTGSAPKSGPTPGNAKPLANFEDGRNASKEEFENYLKSVVGD